VVNNDLILILTKTALISIVKGEQNTILGTKDEAFLRLTSVEG